jgi:hypothetical protein
MAGSGLSVKTVLPARSRVVNRFRPEAGGRIDRVCIFLTGSPARRTS